jgi:hypothetical protein
MTSRNPYPSPPSSVLPSRSLPAYAPQQLLNPKINPRSPQKYSPISRPNSPYFSLSDKRSQVSHNMEEDASSDRKRSLPSEGMSRNSMLESLHNVERRMDQPQKKLKTFSDGLQSGNKSKMSYAHRGNGIIGEYVRPDSGSTEPNEPSIPNAVDLTAGKQEAHFVMHPVHCFACRPLQPLESQVAEYHFSFDAWFSD